MSKNEAIENALRELLKRAIAVNADLNDQSTGWYYQFGAAIEKAERVIYELDEGK